jgi:hypothetical protein
MSLSKPCCISLFILLVNVTILSSWAFQTTSQNTPLLLRSGSGTSTRSSTRLFIGNFISGVTGSAPSQPLLTRELEAQLVKGTSLEDKELECVYKASQDGWSAIDFHQKVDEKGSSLVVALTRSGKVFGGFNPLGWRSTDDYYNSNAAFLWFAAANTAVKCPILPGGTYFILPILPIGHTFVCTYFNKTDN